MTGGWWSQDGYGVRFAWGATGAAQVAAGRGALVVVDVLSFTTSVTVLAERGTDVHPAPWRDRRAAALADEVGAALAVGRREVTPAQPWSLSPAALLSAPAPPRLVLPSPNGSAIAAAADGTLVVAACLRNAAAVGGWLRERAGTPEHPVTVVAAGERWPDGSLRPALEDLLGAGAVLSALLAGGGRASPEAEAAVAAFRGTESVADAVRRCASGLELASTGFADDAEVAVELDASEVVPVLTDGAFRAS